MGSSASGTSIQDERSPVEAPDGADADTSGGTPAATGDDRSRIFAFRHKLFTVDGGYFAIQQSTGEAVFHVPLGDLKGAIALSTLRYEFKLEENETDMHLLDVVEKSLRYVKEIRPFDSVPHELLDGSASWSVEERHRRIARNRLTAHLVLWLTGGRATVSGAVSGAGRLDETADDPRTRQRVQDAFTRLAEKLGYGKERRQDVVDMIDTVARELAYMEALRDRFAHVRYIGAQLGMLNTLYRRDQGVRNDIFRMQALIRPPLTALETMFAQVDAQTSEILSVVRNLQAQIRFIRETRDELHFRLMPWDDLVARWTAVKVAPSTEVEALLKETYRFLARHFGQAVEWPLANRR